MKLYHKIDLCISFPTHLTAPQSDFLNSSYAIFSYVLKIFKNGIQIPKSGIRLSLTQKSEIYIFSLVFEYFKVVFDYRSSRSKKFMMLTLIF